MKANLLLAGMLGVALSGCTEAYIADFASDKVFIGSNIPADDEKQTIEKEARRGCEIANPGSEPMKVSTRCTLYGNYNVCWEYMHLFACR